MGSRLLRRSLLLVWALALAAGLSFNTAQAEALHSSCASQCSETCGAGECKRAVDLGCTCLMTCSDGSSHTAICVL